MALSPVEGRAKSWDIAGPRTGGHGDARVDSDHAECEGVSIDSALLFLYTPIEEYDLHCFSMAHFYLWTDFYAGLRDFCPVYRGSKNVKFSGVGVPL